MYLRKYINFKDENMCAFKIDLSNQPAGSRFRFTILATDGGAVALTGTATVVVKIGANTTPVDPNLQNMSTTTGSVCVVFRTDVQKVDC